MQIQNVFALASLALTTLAAPTYTNKSTTHITKRLAENAPWHLSNLTVFTANPGYVNSSISFNFQDSNPGLELNVTCSRSELWGGIVDADEYYPCGNGSVSFRWDGSILDVERGYVDPSVGPYPYWFVTAFGHAQPNLTLYYLAEEGKGVRQNALDMPITELTAK